MSADEPGEATGAVRGGRAPGRHRTDQPEVAPQTPAVGFPAPDHRPTRPRHARGGETRDPAAARRPPEPSTDFTYDDWPGGNGNGNSAGWNGAGPDSPARDSTNRDSTNWDSAAGRNGSGRNGDQHRTSSSPADSARTAFPRTAFPRTGRQDDGRFDEAPNRGDPYAEAPHSAERYRADPYRIEARSGDPYPDDRYRSVADRPHRGAPDRYDASGPGSRSGADTYRPGAREAAEHGSDAPPGRDAGGGGISWDLDDRDPTPLTRADGGSADDGTARYGPVRYVADPRPLARYPRDAGPQVRHPADAQPGVAHAADAQPQVPQAADAQPQVRHPDDPQPQARHPADARPLVPHPADAQPHIRHPDDPQPQVAYPADPRSLVPHPADAQPHIRHPDDPQPQFAHPADAQPQVPQAADAQPQVRHPDDPQPQVAHPADPRHPDDPEAQVLYPGDPRPPGRHPADPPPRIRYPDDPRPPGRHPGDPALPVRSADRPDRRRVRPSAAPPVAFDTTGGAPRTATAGGPDLHHDLDRPHVEPPPPDLHSRRPGDPPRVPAELFVDTTAETLVIRLDDEPPAPPRRSAPPPAATTAPTTADTPTEDAPTEDERAAEDDRPAEDPAEDPADDATAEPAPDEPRPDSSRTSAGPVAVPLPPWARRLIGSWAGAGEGGEPEPGAGHGHGHGPTRPAGRRVRILIAALLVPCALAALVGVLVLWPSGGPPATAEPISQEQVRAQVTATRATDCSAGSGAGGCVALVVRMADGPRPGRDLVQVVPVEPGSPQFAVGDQVVLGWSGANPDDAGSYQVVDFQRGAPLAWLAGLFAVAVLLLGRWRGLAALAALALSFVVLLYFVVPAILAGRDPLAVAVVGACLIMFAVLYLTHGPSARTSTAVLGTLLSLALIGALGAAFSAAAKLTGLDDQTSNLIASLGTGVDARGLLLAGVVIGALGVLDDVTVTQTSAVWELHHANPRLGARGLFTAAMRIGRDHVASAVNTLVLAYAGAALPLLLLFSLSGRGLGEVATAQDVATEIVRTLVGSIGLVASVPITTALAAAVAVRETAPPTSTAAA